MYEQLNEYPFHVKHAKCQIFLNQIEFLGHMVSDDCWRAPRRAVHGQLFATYWEKLLQVFGLVPLCLGRVHVGFVAGALVRSRLFWPFGTLSLDLLGLLRPIGRTLGLGQGYCALGSVFRLCCWALLVDPLYFLRNSTSGHCCPSRHFFQGWTTIGNLP